MGAQRGTGSYAKYDGSIHLLADNLRQDSKGVTVLCGCRNEAWRLPCFLEHLRGLGVERLIFIDNDSEDDTVAWLKEQPDVALYSCRLPFSSTAQYEWRTAVAWRHGLNRWYLNLDADEHPVYEGMERHDLNALAKLALREGNRRIRGLLVDMYGPGTAEEHGRYQTCRDVLEYCRHFDGEPPLLHVNSKRVGAEGGMRARMSAQMGLTERPELTKYPLCYMREGEIFAGPHSAFPASENFISKCVIALLHYKFSSHDYEKIEEALRRRHHYNASAEYKMYAAWMEQKPARPFSYEMSREYASPADLIDSGILEAIDWEGAPATRVRWQDVSSWRHPIHRKQLCRFFRKQLRRWFLGESPSG